MNATIEAAALAELRERIQAAARDKNEKAHARLKAIAGSDIPCEEWIERYDMRQHNIATGEWAEVVSENCPMCGGTLYADACISYYGGHGNTRQTYCLCGWSVVGRHVELAQPEELP